MSNFFKRLGEILTMDIRQAIFKRENTSVPVLTQAVEPTEKTRAETAPYKVEAPAADPVGTPVVAPVKKARKPAKKRAKKLTQA